MFDIDDTNLSSSLQIKVIGIGGGGISAVNRMIENNLEGVEFIAVDIDSGDLSNSQAPRRIHITENPKENSKEILNVIEDTDMIFVVAGMGGRAGTSIAPIIAKYSKELGALTVAVVACPFENENRNKNAYNGIEKLRSYADSVIIISGDKILQAGGNISKEQAFSIADEYLKMAVQGISQLITMPGVVNMDVEDLLNIIGNSGKASVGVGQASGEKAAMKAAQAALDSPLLENMQNALSVVINIMGAGESLKMLEVNEAASLIQDAASVESEIMWGMSIDESLGDTVRVMIIATRFAGHPEKFKFVSSSNGSTELPL